MEAPSFPTTQVLAFSYAALEPSSELLDKFLAEIDKLEARGDITEFDHQMLRSYPHVYPELMHLTLGEDTALTEKTVTQLCNYVSDKIKEEERKKLSAEQEAHRKTQEALEAERTRNQEIVENLAERCQRQAKIATWTFTTLLGIAILSSMVLGIFLENQTLVWTFFGIPILIAFLMALANIFYGINLRSLHNKTYQLCLAWLYRRCAKNSSVNVGTLKSHD